MTRKQLQTLISAGVLSAALLSGAAYADDAAQNAGAPAPVTTPTPPAAPTAPTTPVAPRVTAKPVRPKHRKHKKSTGKSMAIQVPPGRS